MTGAGSRKEMESLFLSSQSGSASGTYVEMGASKAGGWAGWVGIAGR